MMDDLEEVQGYTPPAPPIVNEFEFDIRLRKLAALIKDNEDMEAILKVHKAEADALSASLAQYMINSGCLSKVLDGITFKQKQRVFSKVEDKEALRQWITDNAAVDLLMAVHPSKLTAYCNECLEAGGTTPAGVNPNFIKYFVHVKG